MISICPIIVVWLKLNFLVVWSIPNNFAAEVNNKEIYADQDRELPTAVTVASTFLILTGHFILHLFFLPTNFTQSWLFMICWCVLVCVYRNDEPYRSYLLGASEKGWLYCYMEEAFNNSCYLNREAGVQPPLCDKDDDPDNVW